MSAKLWIDHQIGVCFGACGSTPGKCILKAEQKGMELRLDIKRLDGLAWSIAGYNFTATTAQNDHLNDYTLSFIAIAIDSASLRWRRQHV